MLPGSPNLLEWRLKDQTKIDNRLNSAIILIGSNISPEENVILGIQKLGSSCKITDCSSIWETASIGTSAPNFLNLALRIETYLSATDLKNNILCMIELELGRVRTGDKCAPRTLDLDIIVFNNDVLDQDLWKNAFIALPVSELIPDLPHPITGEPLIDVAKRLQKDTFAVVRPDLKVNI